MENKLPEGAAIIAQKVKGLYYVFFPSDEFDPPYDLEVHISELGKMTIRGQNGQDLTHEYNGEQICRLIAERYHGSIDF